MDDGSAARLHNPNVLTVSIKVLRPTDVLYNLEDSVAAQNGLTAGIAAIPNKFSEIYATKVV